MNAALCSILLSSYEFSRKPSMKNKIFITLLIFGTTLFSTNISFAQFPQWTEMKLFAGNWHDVGYSIYIDKHDNYYIAGQLQDPIPGSTPANFQVDCREVPAPRIGEVNGFVLRYDSNRNLTLQITLPGRPMEVRADSIGNIYVVGRVEYDYSFDGIDTIFNGGTGDGFITKYSPEGNLLWYRIVKSGDNDAIVSIDIRKDGNIAICGYANGDATWFLEKWITAPIDFVATLNSDGRLNWVTSISQDLGGGA
ncbi:MAG TPA: hypothetical protein VKT28_09520, partial [Puia sp.]|nr:hypothetical protein [Puia sp.]